MEELQKTIDYMNKLNEGYKLLQLAIYKAEFTDEELEKIALVIYPDSKS